MRGISFSVDAGRDRRAHRAERRREVHDAARDHGARPGAGGEITLGGRSLRGRSPEAIARSGVALVPEGRRLFAELTVEENLRLGLAARASSEGLDEDLAEVVELFPVVRRVPRSSCGRALGRAAAAARDRARARREAVRSSARRAVARTRADGRRSRLLDAPDDRRARHRRPSRRAARTAHGGARRPGRTCWRTASSGSRSRPEDAADTDRMVAAYLS